VCECADVDIEALRLYAQAVMVEVGHQAVELSVLLADDAYVRELNREYRGVDRTTNVLAFPQQESPESVRATRLLGDVVISVEKARRDSAREHISLTEELKKLVVHGILHLCGHDHRTTAQGTEMRRLERAIIERTHDHGQG
jgi:probable rRNA maturation factor